MDSLETLKNTLQKFEGTILSFPVSATAAREPSIENKIRKTVCALLLAGSQLLTLKAKIDESKQAPVDESVDEAQLISELDEYEKAASKFMLQKELWRNSIAADTINNILCGKIPLDGETYESIKSSLLQFRMVQDQLQKLREEQSKTLQQIMEKRKELSAKMRSYTILLDKKRQRCEEQMSQPDQMNQHQKRKLEKLNVMRQLMIHLVTINANFLKQPEWTELLVDAQKHITLEDLD